MKAAILYEFKTPLRVEDVDLGNPKAGEVRVKIVASGVCHSDYSVIHGVLGAKLPAVLGHEGAGIVEEVGPGVTLVKPGDHVVLSVVANCGHCSFCATGQPVLCDNLGRTLGRGTMLDGTTRLSKNGVSLSHLAGLASFAQYAVVPEATCIPIANNVPLDKACLVGCGVMTGVGAAINTAKVAPGSSAVVIGCGGVGLNVIQGCALAGARTIIGVDLLDNKLEYAKEFGASHTINPGRQDLLKTVRSLTDGRGADYAFEVIGLSKTMEQAYMCTHRGGMTVIVGAGSREDIWNLPVGSFLLTEKMIKSSTYGSSRPRVDLPRLIDLYMSKQIKLDELVSRTYPLEDINQSMTAMEKGEVARSVIMM